MRYSRIWASAAVRSDSREVRSLDWSSSLASFSMPFRYLSPLLALLYLPLSSPTFRLLLLPRTFDKRKQPHPQQQMNSIQVPIAVPSILFQPKPFCVHHCWAPAYDFLSCGLLVSQLCTVFPKSPPPPIPVMFPTTLLRSPKTAPPAPKGQGQFLNSCKGGHEEPVPALCVSTLRVRFLAQLELDVLPDCADTTACVEVAATGIHLPQGLKRPTWQLL